MHRLAVFVALSLSFAPCLPASAAPTDPAERERRLQTFVTQLEEARLKHHVPGLAVVVVMDDEVVLARGLGAADIDEQRAVTPRTVFAIGSTSKAFTATLASMLAEERVIGLDEPISSYVHEFDLALDSEDPGAKATLRDALSHRTGFARMGALWAGGSVTKERMFQTASLAEPVAPYRSEFHYNNVVFSAAGEALARATGRSYETLLRNRLLKPLGMRHVSLSTAQAAKDKHLATGYNWIESSQSFEALPMRDLGLVSPAGAINTSVLDLSRWIRMNLSRGMLGKKRIASASAIEATWKPQASIGGGVAYGLGWMLREHDGRAVVEHGGNIDGFAAQVTLFPEDNMGYAVLMNVSASPIQQLSVSMAADTLLGEEEAESADSSGGTKGGIDMERLVGTYVANFGPFKEADFDVSVVEGKLHVNVPGQMNFELKQPDDSGKWYFAMTDTIAVSFDEAGQDAAEGMKMYQGGLTFDLPREGLVVDKAPVAVPKEWDALLGKYRSPSLQADITVLVQNGNLALDVPGQMVFELDTPTEGRWPFRVSSALEVEFKRDAAGKVESVTQYRGGHPVETWPRTGSATPRGASSDVASVLSLVKAEERGKALKRLGGIRLKGTVRKLSSGISGDITWLLEGTDKQHQVIDMSPFVEASVVVNGARGSSWSSLDRRRDLVGKLHTQAHAGHFFSLFADWREFFDEVSYVEPGTLDGVQTHVVKLEVEGLEPFLVHVDAKSGDVLQMEATHVLENGLGSLAMTSRFANHQDVGGLRIPHKLSVENAADGVTLMELESVETGKSFSADQFRVD